MANINFQNWIEKHPDLKSQITSISGTSFGRIFCKWNEIKENSKAEHIYASTINLKNGDLYLDCRARKIWAKCCLYVILQPLLLTAKTVYHVLLPISIPYEIYKTVQAAKKEEQKVSGKLSERILIQIGKNFADIGRTPIYAIALTVIGIGGVILGLSPNKLYSIRLVAGNIEKSLNWGNENSAWILFKCFQPFNNLAAIDQWNDEYEDTAYLKNNKKRDPILRGLSNFARSQIQFRRNNRALFNDCLRKYPMDKPYISAAIKYTPSS